MGEKRHWAESHPYGPLAVVNEQDTRIADLEHRLEEAEEAHRICQRLFNDERDQVTQLRKVLGAWDNHWDYTAYPVAPHNLPIARLHAMTKQALSHTPDSEPLRKCFHCVHQTNGPSAACSECAENGYENFAALAREVQAKELK